MTVSLPKHLNAANRHDFVLLFDVTNGNPNGDPDAGNLPRIDFETGIGLVTDVALKRKVRNYVDLVRGDEARYKIYIQQGAILNHRHRQWYDEQNKDPKQATQLDILTARQFMCDNYYDIRTFGALMSTEINAGQVRGPVQLTFAHSIDPITPMDMGITRVALTKPSKKQQEDDQEIARSGMMGRKAYIPYGLYVAYGYYTPAYAKATGFNHEDLALFWQSLVNMWDFDHSSARGRMACRGLHIYSHDSALGNAPAQKLFDGVKITRKSDIEIARQFQDYVVQITDGDLPHGITLTSLV